MVVGEVIYERANVIYGAYRAFYRETTRLGLKRGGAARVGASPCSIHKITLAVKRRLRGGGGILFVNNLQ